MADDSWGFLRLISVTAGANGRLKLVVECEADAHRLAEVAADILHNAVDETRRRHPQRDEPGGPPGSP